MNAPQDPISNDDLHAYADGLLDEQRHAAVAAFLADHPEKAAMVADWQAQNAGIRELFAGHGKARPGDAELLRSQASRARPSVASLRWLAAAALIFVAGAATGALTLPLVSQDLNRVVATSAPNLAREARSAFLIYASEVRHPVEVFAEDETHLATWLGKRLDHALTIPDISSTGFSLVGGRLVPVGGGPGALLMYENGAGQRVTVLIGRDQGARATSFRYDSTNGVETFYWIDGDLGYAVSGDIDRQLLRRIADECYRQLPARPVELG